VKMNRTFLLISAQIFLLTTPTTSHARSGYKTEFLNLYGWAANTKLDSCALCHGATKSIRNSYGLDMEAWLDSGKGVSQSLLMIDGLDSDGDGWINLDEINGVTFPGDGTDFPTSGECVSGQTRPCYTGPAGTEDLGLCAGGTESCVDSFWAGTCVGEVLPSAEVCEGLFDENCDGTVDDGCPACTDGETRACYSGPSGTENVGECAAGTESCVVGVWSGTCSGEITPTAETCDDLLDNNCDGQTDEGCGQCVDEGLTCPKDAVPDVCCSGFACTKSGKGKSATWTCQLADDGGGGSCTPGSGARNDACSQNSDCASCKCKGNGRCG
jgi:hypothetical protein